MYNEMKNLMLDFAMGKAIVDEGQSISAETVNDKIRAFCLEKLGLDENASPKQIKRAIKKESFLDLQAVIEEVIEAIVVAEIDDNDFLNKYLERINLTEGDIQDFYTEDDSLFSVSKIGPHHHDLIVQMLPEGKHYIPDISTYAVKTGTDISLFLTGQKNWDKWCNTAAKSIVKAITEEAYAEVMNASTQLPAVSQFNKNGTLSAATKEAFDTLIEDVAAANGTDVVIMGSKTALKKLNNIALVDWISDSQKEAYAEYGYMGSYEGTELLALPQRFADNTLTKKLIDNNKLLIMPLTNDNKFIKMVDYGELTLEVTERGETMNDQQSFEIQRQMGIGVVISRYFGCWTM